MTKTITPQRGGRETGMTWADEARVLVDATPAAKRAFVARAVSINTANLDDSAIEDARRKIATGYRMGTVALDLEDQAARVELDRLALEAARRA